MFAVSNAMMSQAEVVQRDLWERGPLELLFIPSPRRRKQRDWAWDLAIGDWNRSWRGGRCRSGETMDECFKHVPQLERMEAPAFLVPDLEGKNELLRALTSLAPSDLLRRHGIDKKPRATLWLWPSLRDDVSAASLDAAAREFVWNLLSRSRARSLRAFSARDPLRLLAADTRFWMHRLMRIALDRHEEFYAPIPEEKVKPSWSSLDEIRQAVHEDMDDEDRARYDVRRPLYGGDLWLPDDQAECDDVADELIHGAGVVDSLEPIIEAIEGQRCHEDFSDRWSWIREDFERSFYSKRARVQVSLVQSLDDCPAWDAAAPTGYDKVLFRDVLSVFDARDRRIIIALRHGKTQAEIAADLDLKGHASISRRIARLRAQLKRLLDLS